MKIMTTIQPNNPFLIAGYYSPAYFCDRQQETATIISALHNERNLTLVAPRRMGKTEMVYRTEAGYIVYDRFFAIWLRFLT